MDAFSRTPMMKAILWIAGLMVVVVVFHIGGPFALSVGQFSPLVGAIIGSGLTLMSVGWPRKPQEGTEPWIGQERLSWLLMGLAMLMWAIGEGFWRYFISIGQTPFPSAADIGYSLFPPLAFIGLLLQPAPDAKSRRMTLVMDCLISMGSLFAVAWYLLLGTLAQAHGEANLAKFLGLYYPTSDTALLSCVAFLLLRGQQGSVYQARARRLSLLLVGLGICFFVASDFLFNVEQNAGTYVEATWVDLGWPLGMMTMGLAASVRRFFPVTPPEVIGERVALRFQYTAPNPFQFVPYGLLGLLFLTLTLNVLASDAGQRTIRPVLLFATISVIALVVGRQILTLRDNMLLARRQEEALEHLARVNQRVEEQARQIADHNAELERGIAHLCSVHAHLANGDLRARAKLTRGALMPLAGSLNLMAERLMRMGQASLYAQQLLAALHDLSTAFENQMRGAPLVIPASCQMYVEIQRLLVALGIKREATPAQPSSASRPLTPIVPSPSSASAASMSSPSHVRLRMTQPLVQHARGPTGPSTESSSSVEQRGKVLGLRRSPTSGGLGME